MTVSADGFEWTQALTRVAVAGRSMRRCEWCGRRNATDMHHRRNASQGGKWHPANIVHLCRECHGTVTINPAWAHDKGLTLWAGEEPDETPLRFDGGDVYLTDNLIAKAGANA